MFLPPIRTARLSLFRRAPLHSLHMTRSLASASAFDFRAACSKLPNPAHTGQAPLGLLNENRLGTISGKEPPHSAQANFWLKRNSLVGAVSACTSILTICWPTPEAVSSESARRFSIPSLI